MAGSRKRAESHQSISDTLQDHWKGFGVLVAKEDHGCLTTSSTGSACSDQETLIRNLASPALPSSLFRKLGQPFLPYAAAIPASQQPDRLIFPISLDHRLITLVQYNALRAMLFNMAILSTLDSLPAGCPRQLGIPSFGKILPAQIPQDLRTTQVQSTTPHPPWMNAIPFPELRNNMILLPGKYDTNALAYDLGQGLYEGFDDPDRRGFLVWGDPWNPNEWEVSDGFVRKWGFLLHGCSDVIDTTNRWRQLRGEDNIILEIR